VVLLLWMLVFMFTVVVVLAVASTFAPATRLVPIELSFCDAVQIVSAAVYAARSSARTCRRAIET
jgi:hypothetical protein